MIAQWALYAITASAAFGISAIPIRMALSKAAASSELILLTSAIGSLVGALIYLFITGNEGIQIDRCSVLCGAVSGLIGIIGSISVIKALGSPSSTVANVMSLVNTNLLFTVIFSLVLLGEVPEGMSMMKTLVGALLILAGSVVICR